MGRKKKLPPDDPERSARFMEIAEQIQDEKAEERFEEVVKRVLSVRAAKLRGTRKD
jgi:hypothetical protein